MTLTRYQKGVVNSDERQRDYESAKKVLAYMVKSYKLAFTAVVLCILGTALATLKGTLFMQKLIDDYIVPMTQTASPDFGPLAKALLSLAGIYAAGVLCAYAHNRTMVNISQGRCEICVLNCFTHMESLPIKYFDTHVHGDIMSVYTNDVIL